MGTGSVSPNTTSDLESATIWPPGRFQFGADPRRILSGGTMRLSYFCRCYVRSVTSKQWQRNWRTRFETRNQIKDCYVVLATAGLLVGPMNNHLVQLCSQTLYESFKRGLRRSGKFGNGDALYRGHFSTNRSYCKPEKTRLFQASNQKPLSEEEVIAMKELFDKMGSDTVSQVVIKSTSITKVLRRIYTRGDDFAIKY
ncbi:hypothetical protein B0H14DRAFT_3737268 [Mycena olivaceomarginata]|nr:hypothetical protein B0H14DRAFT_3737268 [Mycena olivaceomarginata]